MNAEPRSAKRVLVVFHSRTGSTKALAEVVLQGARDAASVADVPVLVRVADALAPDPSEVQAADAVILGTPENFGYMSGALKHFFDEIYEPCREHTRGLPYGLFVKASTDGTGAVRAVQRIVTGLGWREVLAPVLVVGPITDEGENAAHELGATIVAGVGMGLY